MGRTSIWTVIGVILAVIIAWIVVDALFKLLFFFAKLMIVAVVALLVFFALRSLFSRRD